MEPAARLFGSAPRTRILIAVALLTETYPRELARLLDLARLTVQRILDSFEREGVILSRIVGRNRVVSLNRRMYGAAELEAFLLKYARHTDLDDIVSRLRRRPRRRGKAL
jgi:DNA-binding transcriptional ArsR family regulator